MPSYNIPGVTAELKFTPEALAGIFLGKITKWNDPGHRRPESGREAPGRRHRSGPPLRWQRHHLHLDRLSFQGQREWKTKVGTNTSVNWPVGLGGKGNEGVAG